MQEKEPITQLFSEIGVYNTRVREHLKNKPLNLITQRAIQIFRDQAQRYNYTDQQYNKAVTEFNNLHGLLLLKKGKEQKVTAVKHYSYINYPYLDREGMKKAMHKYREFVNRYNLQVQQENKEVLHYNKSVVKPTPDKLLQYISDFKAKNSHLFTRKYNVCVMQANAKLGGKYIAKKRISTIKYNTELVFSVLIGFYIGQLKKRNTYLMQINAPTSVLKNDLPKLKIDHRKLATHTIEGIPRLSICKRTAQNQIKRLREAGILVNYRFFSSTKPIQVNFNPTIVTILDGNPPKKQNTKNQCFTSKNTQTLPYNSDTTRSFSLKEKEIKDYAKSIVGKKCDSRVEHQNGGVTGYAAQAYKVTMTIARPINTQGGAAAEQTQAIRDILPDFLKTPRKTPEKNVIKANTNERLTQNFLRLLKDDSVLAQELAAGDYDNYKGLRYDYLQKMEQYARVSSEEFKAILIQDFLKCAAKIWKKHTVYVGEWKKTINYLKEVLFKNITQKETLITYLKRYRWLLNFARKWFIKSGVNALYPSLYFDTTRTKSNEIGFFGLHSVWKSHVKYKAKRAEQNKQQKRQGSRRKRTIKHAEKLMRAIKKYFAGEYSSQQLYNYVDDNLPDTYVNKLHAIIQKEPQLL